VTAALDPNAVRYVLRDYRMVRAAGRHSPYYAAREVRHLFARYLADQVLSGTVSYFAVDSYRAARAVAEATNTRAGLMSGRKFSQMTRREQYWQTGRLAGAR
jgi:hypothetical protein